MVHSDLPKPLYEQIKDYILRRIHTGEFTPNTRIPSERDLAEQFEVSRATVGKAIKELVQAGHLYVQIGKGTYINDPPIKQEVEALTSFTEEMHTRGHPTASRVLQAEIIPAALDTAQALGLLVGSEVMRLVRVRYAGERPMALERSRVVAAICPGILRRHDFSQESLYAVLRENYRINLAYAEQAFEARAADIDEARHLAIEAGAPVLAIHRVTYTADDRPVEVVDSVYRGDRYTFRAKLKRI